MSLPNESVLSLLESDFVVGWKNIQREDYVGASHGYTCSDTAVGTTNGAGPRNVQMFVLSRGATVVHCLPGFWHPDDLVEELQLAKALHQLWTDDRSRVDKRAMFGRMQLGALRGHSKAMTARSGWQGFDANAERTKLTMGPRDTFYLDASGKPADLKPLNVLVHERMAQRPYVNFKSFDTDQFVDYGRPYYDNNRGGVSFEGSPGYLESQRRMAERRAEREARKARDKERVLEQKKLERKLAKERERAEKAKGSGQQKKGTEPNQ